MTRPGKLWASSRSSSLAVMSDAPAPPVEEFRAAARAWLARAGYVLAREGAFSIVEPEAIPPALVAGIRFARLFERGALKRTGRVERLTRALNRLGPT